VTTLNAVQLHTGVQVASTTLSVTLVSLRAVSRWPDGRLVLHDLRQMAADPLYVPYADTVERLTELGLVEHGGLHDDIRSIVLAAVDEDGFTLRDPRVAS